MFFDRFRAMILGGSFPSPTILKTSIVKRTSGWKQGALTKYNDQQIFIIICVTIVIICVTTICSTRTIINTQASLDNGANFLNETQVRSGGRIIIIIIDKLTIG